MKKTVEFTVKASDGVRARKIAVNDRQVDLTNDNGAIDLKANTDHVLVWWFEGNPGDTLSILGETKNSNGGRDQVVVEIPPIEIIEGTIEAGRMPFSFTL